ncbi:hypothetical protein HDV01_007588 [Terramyces sp. JEL0728]|nr:hypothetical protein HDV01_007588 [Terramyces sp. JEL0728]
MSLTDLLQQMNVLDIDDEISPWNTETITAPPRALTFNPASWTNVDVNRIPRTVARINESIPANEAPAPRTEDPLAQRAHHESVQQELVQQLRELEQAHEELDMARNELMQALSEWDEIVNQNDSLVVPHVQEANGVLERSRRMLENAHRVQYRTIPITVLNTQSFLQEASDSESEDYENEPPIHYIGIGVGSPSSHYYGLGINIHSSRYPQSSAFPNDEIWKEIESELEHLFLDANGDFCSGIDDCLSRAVGWATEPLQCSPADLGLDANGEQLYIVADEDPIDR